MVPGVDFKLFSASEFTIAEICLLPGVDFDVFSASELNISEICIRSRF